MTLLNTPPAVGFDQPFEMLEACHERVERSLDLLLRLDGHVQSRGAADAAARDAARDLLRYFDLAAPHHHEDEERHVLPLLARQGHGELAARIAAEHRELHAAYAALRPGLLALRDQGLVPERSAWPAFAARYRAHIDLEERVAYPVARDACDAAARVQMGDEMAARRRGGPAGA